MNTSAFDVAILGGGPAGCATALRLRQHAPHLSVALIEASAHQHQHQHEPIGETLPPPAQDLLRGLGVWQAFLEQKHVQNFGTLSTWGGGEAGGDDFISTPFARGWHLDRRMFDQMLLEAAESAGVTLFRESCFKSATRTAAGWDLELLSRGSTKCLPCSFVSDATGRRAVFAARTGARRMVDDSMVGLSCFFPCEGGSERDTRLILEPARGGWWYSAVLPAGRALTVFMTDGDIARELKLARAERFRQALAGTELIRHRVAEAQLEGPPRMMPAGSGCLSKVRGDRWVAVGDAAATLDPLCGQGILKAMTNGIHAAYAIADALSGDDRGLERYGRSIMSAYEQYLDTRDEYYAAESRWPTARFWRRRQPQITLDPMAQVALGQLPARPALGMRGRVLSEVGSTPQSACDIVRRVKKQNPSGASDRRLVLTLQRLLQSGAVAEGQTVR